MKQSKNTNQPTFNDVSDCCIMCGSRIVGRWETLSRGLCGVLVKIQRAIAQNGGAAVHLQKDLELTKSEFANAQKLKYFNLLRQTETAGYWKLTRVGEAFLKGLIERPKKVFVFRNEVKERSAGTVTIGQVMRSREKFWMEKTDYVAESAAVGEV